PDHPHRHYSPTRRSSDLSNLKFNDSGLNKTINSLNRLFQADFGKFNPADFSRITSSISTLGNMPDVSSGVNRFVSSLSRLANARSEEHTSELQSRFDIVC